MTLFNSSVFFFVFCFFCLFIGVFQALDTKQRGEVTMNFQQVGVSVAHKAYRSVLYSCNISVLVWIFLQFLMLSMYVWKKKEEWMKGTPEEVRTPKPWPMFHLKNYSVIYWIINLPKHRLGNLTYREWFRDYWCWIHAPKSDPAHVVVFKRLIFFSLFFFLLAEYK